LRLADKPFVILTVSLDDDLEALKNVLKSLNPPGTHTWDQSGSDNPVGELYNIQALPTSYLMDPKGVIRAKDPDAVELADTVLKLLPSS
jgi:hypothetical protein